jgi:hypothetical protein
VADTRIDELRRRLERDPGSRLFAQLAEEHRKAGNHSDAIRVAREGLAKHPAYPSARLTLGRALLDSGDAAGARVELETALKDAPDNILASRFLGQALEKLGELRPAVEQLEKTLKMAPGDRQLDGQIASLRERLKTASVGAGPLPPAEAVSAPPPASVPGPAAPPHASWDVTAPTRRTAAAQDDDEALPATIRIRPPGEPGAWGRRTSPPPPLPPSAAPTAPTPAGPPPLPPPASSLAVTARLPPTTLASYESDVAPTLPPTPVAAFGLADETGVPTLPPGALAAEETVFEAEPGPAGAELPVGPVPPAEPEVRSEAVVPAEPPAPAGAVWPAEADWPAEAGVPAEPPEPPIEHSPQAQPAPPPPALPPDTRAAASGPGLAVPDKAEPSPAATPFSSSTLAELYLRQGLVDRAVEVYKQLLVEEPGNERARSRLAELERTAPPDSRSARRRQLERMIAGLEALLAAVQRA